jgi:tRNA(Ile)-lysidine synthase
MVPDDKAANAMDARLAMREIHAALQSALQPRLRGQKGMYVLAVSGGMDSMVLLHAAAAVCPLDRLVVGTFDHGTGSAATLASHRVKAQCATFGIECHVGRASTPGTTEAEWRRGRWEFLMSVAKSYGASVVTAHTRDDQIETVFIRALRDAGPRGLAALYAPSPVVRPLLGIARTMVQQYSDRCGITFVTDPSNADRRHLRNRVRLDLLPAILAVDPQFGEDLLDLAQRAADWRARIDQIATTFTMMHDATGSYTFPRPQFAEYSEDALRTLWPALAARTGVVMDWRGTHRLATFTIEGETGQSIQLSGGITVHMRRTAIVVQRDGGCA